MVLTFIDFVTQGWLKRKRWTTRFYYPFYWVFKYLTLSFLYRPMVYNFLDTRFGKPRLLVADRGNRRLVHTDLEGNFIGVHAKGLRLPCMVDIMGEFCAVAELEARVTILGQDGVPVAFLGDNPDKGQWAKFGVAPGDCKEGIFTAPHGLCFDREGNLYVQDWNATGRVTKLVRK